MTKTCTRVPSVCMYVSVPSHHPSHPFDSITCANPNANANANANAKAKAVGCLCTHAPTHHSALIVAPILSPEKVRPSLDDILYERIDIHTTSCIPEFIIQCNVNCWGSIFCSKYFSTLCKYSFIRLIWPNATLLTFPATCPPPIFCRILKTILFTTFLFAFLKWNRRHGRRYAQK